MKKLIFILMVSSLFSQIAPYISLGTNISLNNKNGIRWGYEITGGILAGPLHLKMSYGKKHFRNLTQFIKNLVKFAITNGVVAEWLGRGLQNLVQRFESARHLNNFKIKP